MIALILLLILVIILIVAANRTNIKEGFSKYGYRYEIPKGLTNRQTILHNLNKDRGFLGHFYVDCPKCSRSFVKPCGKTNQSYQSETCTSPTCIIMPYAHQPENTMSFYNDNYVDKDQTFCYNCLLDNDTKRFMRNYLNFPYTNGPPGTNTFSY